MEKHQKSTIVGLVLHTRDVAGLLRTTAMPQKGRSSVHLWWKGLRYFEYVPSSP